jgi:hypothetical protein
MKVFDLQCELGHRFEGWFASHDAFEQQNEGGLVVCPICGSVEIARQVTAARINTGAAAPAQAASDALAVPPQAMWKFMRSLVDGSEDVGERFAAEARAIHYGESPERSIRGRATADERQALAEEGIETLSLPMPGFLKEPLQ